MTFLESGATFSRCNRYRYRLWRVWDYDLPTVAFIMLNPSTADASKLDPTVRRCVGYAKAWGFGALDVGNIFALRSTDPSILADVTDPVGPENDLKLWQIAHEADAVICAWGVHGALYGRGRNVVAMLRNTKPLMVLRITREGHPAHPLYLPKDLTPIPWARAAEVRTA